MNICFTCDGNYLRALEVALISVLENTNDKVTFHIVKGSNFEVDSICAICDKYGSEIAFYKLDSKLKAPGRFTPAIYSRLFLDIVVSEKLDRILYLDCDLVVRSDLRDFYYSDFNDKYLIATEDFGDSYIEKFKLAYSLEQYFNSGVLLFNMRKLREDDIFKNARDSYSLAFKYADQDMLNLAVNGAWLSVGDEYNYMGAFLNPDAKIVHYAHCKPWEYFCFNNNSGVYFDYEKLIVSNSSSMHMKFSLKRVLRNIYNTILGWF